MPHDGRTPSLVITNGVNTVTLEGLNSPFPFSGRDRKREFTVEKTRLGSGGAGKVVKLFEPYTKATETMDGSIPYCTQAMYEELDAMFVADPPDVDVTYTGVHGTASLSSQSYALISLSDVPDDWDWVNEPTLQVNFTLERNDA